MEDMMRTAEKDRAHQKMLLHGLENLADLGGFIREEVEDEIFNLYPSIVAEKIEKYCPHGKGFWDVADAIEIAIEEMDKYAEFDFDEDGDPFVIPDPEFEEWVVDQVARITSENIQNESGDFWISWDLTRETKKALMELNALDERILFLSSGIGKENKLTAKEIAELDEFACSEEYIIKVIDAIEKILNCCEWGKEEFEQVCATHRSR